MKEVTNEREFFIDNLLVRIHFIIVMIGWTGLAPWEFEFPFPGSLTSTFLPRKQVKEVTNEVDRGHPGSPGCHEESETRMAKVNLPTLSAPPRRVVSVARPTNTSTTHIAGRPAARSGSSKVCWRRSARLTSVVGSFGSICISDVKVQTFGGLVNYPCTRTKSLGALQPTVVNTAGGFTTLNLGRYPKNVDMHWQVAGSESRLGRSRFVRSQDRRRCAGGGAPS